MSELFFSLRRHILLIRNSIFSHLRLLILPLVLAQPCAYPCGRNSTISLAILSRIRDGPPTRKGPGSGSHRTGAPGRGSERGTAGGPPSRSGVGVGLKDWADPSQMVVWLPGKKTSGPVRGGWPYTCTHACAHTQTHAHTFAFLLLWGLP